MNQPKATEWDTGVAKSFEALCADLQSPAGAAKRFPNLESTTQNRVEFVRTCHNTWKRLHEEAVRHILETDAAERSGLQSPLGASAKSFADYFRAIWRRVNDSIVWSVFELDRLVVKRLCLLHPRTYLVESNAAMAMDFVRRNNADPMSFALWTDATSCVDISDVLYVPNGLQPAPELIELKESPVNAEILNTVSLQGADLETRLRELRAKHGESGIKQRQRIVRQKQVSDQALGLLQEGRGIDPVSRKPFEVVGTDVKTELYNDTLNALLLEALKKRGEIIELIGE